MPDCVARFAARFPSPAELWLGVYDPANPARYEFQADVNSDSTAIAIEAALGALTVVLLVLGCMLRLCVARADEPRVDTV